MRLFTLRMKTRHSSGLTSVPVAIMSTVTTMRGYMELRNCLEQILGLAVPCAVGDLGGELVALAEHLPHDLDDVVGVGVVLGEDERLGDGAAAGKQFGEQLVLEGLDHGADLVLGHDVTVKLVRRVLDGSSVASQRTLRVWRSRNPTNSPASMVEPALVMAVSIL